jgi:hypothetical protein
VVAFLNATFDGGERYVARLLKVAEMEQEMKRDPREGVEGWRSHGFMS